MCNTHTSKPTSKRRTHILAGFFEMFSSSKKNPLRRTNQRIQYKTINKPEHTRRIKPSYKCITHSTTLTKPPS